MRSRITSPVALMIGTGLALCAPASAQHDGDILIGASLDGQLKYMPFVDGGTPVFDPAVAVGVLEPIPPIDPTSWRTTEPGFDANVEDDPAIDFYAMEPGAEIWLVAVTDMEPAFSVSYQVWEITHAGDELLLGSYVLHRHAVFAVDTTSPAYDPVRTLWYGTFVLEDRGSTGYAPSAPFTLRFAVAECESGDVDGNGLVDFDDIDPFVAVLADPAAFPVDQRCAADANRDGYVDFDDIDAFVALLGG